MALQNSKPSAVSVQPLKYKFAVADGVNNQGVRMARLSHRKRCAIEALTERFTAAYVAVRSWAFAHKDAIPFTFTPVKDGVPVVGEDGTPKVVDSSKDYLARWVVRQKGKTDAPGPYEILARCGLPSALKPSVGYKVANDLLSNRGLEQMAVDDPRRLTGPEVGVPKVRPVRSEDAAAQYKTALDDLVADPQTAEDFDAALAIVRRPPRAHLVPVLFHNRKCYLLFRHTGSGLLYAAVPFCERKDERAIYPVQQDEQARRLHRGLRGPKECWPKGQDDTHHLESLRSDDGDTLPRSKQWLLLPLWPLRQESGERNIVEVLQDPVVELANAELLEQDGRWYFTITVKMPTAEKYAPRMFLGVHLGYFRIQWTLVERDGKIIEEDTFDLSEVRQIIAAAADQRAHARDHARTDLFPRYRETLGRWRERVVNWIVDKAVECQAAIGIEEVSGVKKSTPSGRANLFRSHWDFGRFATVLTYKAVLVGSPVIGRGSGRQLFQTVPFGVCSNCGASNAEHRKGGGAKRDRPVRYERGEAAEGAHVFCQKCRESTEADVNAARVVAQRCREFWRKRAVPK